MASEVFARATVTLQDASSWVSLLLVLPSADCYLSLCPQPCDSSHHRFVSDLTQLITDDSVSVSATTQRSDFQVGLHQVRFFLQPDLSMSSYSSNTDLCRVRIQGVSLSPGEHSAQCWPQLPRLLGGCLSLAALREVIPKALAF